MTVILKVLGYVPVPEPLHYILKQQQQDLCAHMLCLPDFVGEFKRELKIITIALLSGKICKYLHILSSLYSLLRISEESGAGSAPITVLNLQA